VEILSFLTLLSYICILPHFLRVVNPFELIFFTFPRYNIVNPQELGGAMNIGKAVRFRILELCRQHDITLNKLSIICGITQSTLNNIVSGRNNSTTVSTIQKICDGLEITILDFFTSPLFENLEQEIK